MVKEYPLSREMLAMSRVFESPDSTKKVIAAKGAPEAIFDLCHLTPELVEKYEKLVPVFRTVTGPMTIAGHLWGVDRILMWSKQEEKKFEACLDICTDLCIEIIRNSIDVCIYIYQHMVNIVDKLVANY